MMIGTTGTQPERYELACCGRRAVSDFFVRPVARSGALLRVGKWRKVPSNINVIA
jgi:hypothetical protein